MSLETAQAKGGSDIEAAIHEAAERIQSQSLVLVISDFLQSPARIARAFQHLRFNGHDVTAFHVLDAAELQLPFHGLTELRELETGRKILIDADEMRARYARQVESYLEEMRRAASACAVSYHLIDTRTAVEEALQKRASRP